jgi:hypothetical protein
MQNAALHVSRTIYFENSELQNTTEGPGDNAVTISNPARLATGVESLVKYRGQLPKKF